MRTLPHSEDAEQTTLGSILISPEAIVELVELKLAPDDFYIVRNRWIWEAMLHLYEASTGGAIGIDFLTVTEVLRSRGKLAECGGEAYLTSLIEKTPNANHAVAYASVVLQASVRRKLIAAATQIAKAAYESETSDDLMDLAMAEVERAGGRASNAGMHTWYEATQSQVEDIKRAELLRGEGKSLYIPSGFPALDHLLDGGLAVTELMLLVADPKLGKSVCLKDVAVAASDDGVPVLIFSLEMRDKKYVKRDLHQYVPSVRQKTGQLTEEDWAMIHEYLELAKASQITIDDTPGISLASLRAKVRRWRRERVRDTRGLVIVDYLQLLDSGLSGQATDAQRADHVARFLKTLAGQEEIAIIAASAVSKHDGRAKASDTRYGLGQVHHADVIAVMNPVSEEEDVPRTGPLPDREVTLSLTNRDGAEGDVHLLLRRQKLKFEEVTYKELPNAYN